jgi:GNAT superfamily N-acetyltransferase
MKLVQRDGALHIENLLVEDIDRGKGHGNRGLQTLCDWADKYNVTIKLWANQFDDGPLSTPNLVRWYRSFGFKGTQKSMTRLPG